jgi:hypothetical protein
LIDDYVPPVVRITTPVTSLTVGTNFQFEARYFNVIGELTPGFELHWESSDPNLLEIDAQGNVTPKKRELLQLLYALLQKKERNFRIKLTLKSKVLLFLFLKTWTPKKKLKCLQK